MEPPYPSADTILSEIQTEPLQSLIETVRSEALHDEWTRIPALDAHLSAHSSAHQQRSSFNRGDIIEVQGPSASGKSHLLYHLLITCIVPSQYQSTDIGGWNKAAIFFDTDNTFDVERFYRLLVSYLSKYILPQAASDILGASLDQTLSDAEKLALRCLTNLHIFRPTSTLELAATLLHLPRYHSTHPSLQALEIGILAIDSISAFYWRDRLTVEQMRAAGEDTKPSGKDNPLRHVLVALQNIRASHGPVIILTNWALNPMTKSVDIGELASPFYKQHLHPFPSPFDGLYPSTARPASTLSATAFPNPSNTSPRHPLELDHVDTGFHGLRSRQNPHLFLLTHHITLRRPFINALPVALTLAEQEDPFRDIAAEEGQSQGFIRTPGSADVGQFSFFVTDQDVSTEIVSAR